MIPRKRLDICWKELLYGMVHCVRPGRRKTAEAACQRHTPAPDQAQIFLSVRSGFDALLKACAFPPGGRILTSAITNTDMVRIIEAHGLIPVPIDLHPQTLCPDIHSLQSGISSHTVAILITHLFGGRAPIDDISSIARMYDLPVFEDCAQGYWGDDHTGHPESDVCMFSFGPIKQNTALGGALFFIRPAHLRRCVSRLHATYPVQSRLRFFTRLAKYTLLLFLNRPVPYGFLCAMCRLLGKPHDAL